MSIGVIKSQRWRLGLLLVAVLPGCAQRSGDSLLQQLNSPDTATRRHAAQTLAERPPFDAGTVQALTAALSDPDLEVRRWCCRGLGNAAATSAQSVLEERLHDSELSVRRAAAFALQRIAPDSTAYRQEILTAMRSGDGGVIVAAAKWRPTPKWAADTLISLLKDRRPGIRRLAAEALGELGADSSEARAALERAARDPDDRVREASTATLARLARP